MANVLLVLGVGLLCVAVAAFFLFFFTWMLVLFGAMLVLFLLTQLIGLPLKVSKNGKLIGHVRFFKYKPLHLRTFW